VKVALADVKSPEDRLGAGTRHRRWSASARLERTAKDPPPPALLVLDVTGIGP